MGNITIPECFIWGEYMQILSFSDFTPIQLKIFLLVFFLIAKIAEMRKG